jgi:hypothetical protein
MLSGIRRAALAMLVVMGAMVTPAKAQDGHIHAVPSNWRLQNYIPYAVMLFYTGAPGCTDGGMHGNGMSQDDYNRLWSTIMAAKSMNRPVGILYTGSGPNCNITSFYME